MEFQEYLIEEDEDFYHSQSESGQCLSSHKLIDFIENPILYALKMKGLYKSEEQKEFKFGSGFHCLMLEGEEAFKNRYYVGELINPSTGKSYGSDTKKYKTWEQEIGLPIFNPEDYTKMVNMKDAILRHTWIKDTFENGKPEMVMRGNFNNFLCQIRMDWFTGKSLVDLKTCDNLDKFEYSAKKYKYHVQMAFYQGVFEAITGYKPPTFIIAVETLESHRVGVWLVDDEMMIQKRLEIKNHMLELSASMESQEYKTGYEDLKILSD